MIKEDSYEYSCFFINITKYIFLYISQYVMRGSTLQKIRTAKTQTISALEIELEAIRYWWIYLPSNYHDSFYYTYFNPTQAIPTQVTGAVSDSISLIIMRALYQAKNILKITPHPSSKSADFEMDIIENGQTVHAIVESKGSNRRLHQPPWRVVSDGARQLLATRHIHPASSGFLIITSYPTRNCFLIKVF